VAGTAAPPPWGRSVPEIVPVGFRAASRRSPPPVTLERSKTERLRCPESWIATRSETPARTMFRTAVRRRSIDHEQRVVRSRARAAPDLGGEDVGPGDCPQSARRNVASRTDGAGGGLEHLGDRTPGHTVAQVLRCPLQSTPNAAGEMQMASSLIRGRYVISRVTGATSAVVIPDGAVAQRDGLILAVGTYADLKARYPTDPVLGGPEFVVVPGLVNDHFHVGLTPFQLGAPDLPLELWSFARLGAKEVDTYLDHLYGAMLMIESGTTTVQVLPTIMRHTRFDAEAAAPILRAYREAGMRLSCGITAVDQNAFIAGPQGGDNEFFDRLPGDLASRARALLVPASCPTSDLVAAAEELIVRISEEKDPRLRAVLAPSNVHRCSDALLVAFKALAVRHRTNIHIHLQETVYQKAYGLRKWGRTPLAHLDELGFLGPDVTCGHGVWLTEDDIDLLARTRTSICHNASSNLRVQSGIAPIGRLLQVGIRIALGSDEAGLNDDKDLIQEMRLVLKLHRVPGIASTAPTAHQVLEMATVNGARAAGFGDVGTLEPGQRADMVLLSLRHIEEPYLDEGVPIVDAVVHRARVLDVDTVLIDGELVMQGRRLTRIDRSTLLKELGKALNRPLRPRETERRELASALEPHLRRFYAEPIDAVATPHACYNAR